VDWIIVFLARFVFWGLRALPLTGAARLGRFFGSLAFVVDRRHRRVALVNLQAVFGRERSSKEICALARENFRRIGESFVCGVCTAGWTAEKLGAVLEIEGIEKLISSGETDPMPSRILAIGHFGNFEIFASAACMLPGYKTATTYRAVKPEALNELLLSYRESSDSMFFERRRDAAKLKTVLKEGGIVLGLVSDQGGGPRGVQGPFLGIECSTSPAPAVLARRFNFPFLTAICYRTGLARWRIEIGDEILLREGGKPRTTQAITEDMNRAFERAVRRDPANWFWVHNRWKIV
jgi:KDO2-lipid IV(A) lauroyltransferase